MIQERERELRPEQSGFSIVELMIVLVIIALLTSIGVPIYTSNMKKVRMSEANVSLASIRDRLRVFYVENEGDGYPVSETETTVFDAWWSKVKDGELQGSYFDQEDYTYTGDGSTYLIKCDANGVLDSPRTLDQDGNFAGGLDN
ncbi:MAG: prepilin-type N-terminal cleavage/methylation domain-containing protein [FCB group bacterium]|nr:prepilin-type N-terminal cleavage/methylation domain-containing protein [FCB group bacterium]